MEGADRRGQRQDARTAAARAPARARGRRGRLLEGRPLHRLRESRDHVRVRPPEIRHPGPARREAGGDLDELAGDVRLRRLPRLVDVRLRLAGGRTGRHLRRAVRRQGAPTAHRRRLPRPAPRVLAGRAPARVPLRSERPLRDLDDRDRREQPDAAHEDDGRHHHRAALVARRAADRDQHGKAGLGLHARRERRGRADPANPQSFRSRPSPTRWAGRPTASGSSALSRACPSASRYGLAFYSPRFEHALRPDPRRQDGRGRTPRRVPRRTRRLPRHRRSPCGRSRRRHGAARAAVWRRRPTTATSPAAAPRPATATARATTPTSGCAPRPRRSLDASAGAKLGPYEILGQIGAGGMGEVYRAKDPRLSREVAIKVLPASFSQDADRLRRFEQEAKAAGVLNHPNITAVYDIGTGTTARPTSSRSCSRARRCARSSRGAASHRARPSTTPSRSRRASPPRTRKASSTATSSPRTSSSPETAASRSSTSVWPS